MKMGKHLLVLVRLSKIDVNVFASNNRVQELECLLKESDSQRKNIKKMNEEDKVKLRNLSLLIKKEEAAIIECESDIAKKDIQLTQVKKNDEYKVILKIIEQQKILKSEKEESFLTFLEEEEQAQETTVKNTEERKTLLQDIEDKEKKIQNNLKDTEKEIELHKVNREDLFQKIPTDLKDMYSRILERRKNYGLSPIENDEYCGICAMALMPEIIEDARKGDDLTCCPNCSRILYHTDFLARISTEKLDDII